MNSETVRIDLGERSYDIRIGRGLIDQPATWAALLAVYLHNAAHRDAPIRMVAFPAMGTGFGSVPYDEAARQMAVAYRHYLDPPHRLNWDFVADRQRAIFYDGDRRAIR